MSTTRGYFSRFKLCCTIEKLFLALLPAQTAPQFPVAGHAAQAVPPERGSPAHGTGQQGRAYTRGTAQAARRLAP
ncbi:MAG: hypothetical protein LBF80_02865 [Spirochaetaceae bacterium]|nr:hypothetical protein [Spirochaetaceae bacterium]